MTPSNPLPDACIDALNASLDPALFKALCDPVRVSIVATLAARAEPSSVGDIVSCCDIDFSGVSRHLKILKEAGVVSSSKSGRTVYYHLEPVDLANTLRGMADALESCQPT